MNTCTEMIDLQELHTRNVAHFRAKRLPKERFLQKDSQRFRKPRPARMAPPLLGTIRAGFPSPAEEELCDILSLEEYLVKRPAYSFLLKVNDDSMIEAGIVEGDLVIVERGRDPLNGEIIVVEVDGEWTLKYFRKRGASVSLESANSKYRKFIPLYEMRVAGIVTALIRKYRQ